MTEGKYAVFNDVLSAAIDEAISGLLGLGVLDALYKALRKSYDITRDELPYRLDTVFTVLESVFGAQGTSRIERSIARQLYQKLNLHYEAVPYHTLTDYIERAKRQVADTQSLA